MKYITIIAALLVATATPAHDVPCPTKTCVIETNAAGDPVVVCDINLNLHRGK